MKFIPIILLSLLLQGCAFLDFFKKHDEPTLPSTQEINIDSGALEYCELLNTVKIITFEQFSFEYGELAKQYGVCATKQAAGVKLLKKMGNIK